MVKRNYFDFSDKVKAATLGVGSAERIISIRNQIYAVEFDLMVAELGWHLVRSKEEMPSDAIQRGIVIGMAVWDFKALHCLGMFAHARAEKVDPIYIIDLDAPTMPDLIEELFCDGFVIMSTPVVLVREEGVTTFCCQGDAANEWLIANPLV